MPPVAAIASARTHRVGRQRASAPLIVAASIPPLLVVLPRPGAALTEADMLAFYEGKVARWWVPDAVVFAAELPHTATGKLLKSRIREISGAPGRRAGYPPAPAGGTGPGCGCRAPAAAQAFRTPQKHAFPAWMMSCRLRVSAESWR